jgi:predicted Zn-dependent peptidase
MRKKTCFFTLFFILVPFWYGTSLSYPAEFSNHPDRLQYQPLKYNPPKAERIVLENGIVLFVLEDHELPLVNINAVFKAGSNYDPKGKEGLAEITSTMMRTGGISRKHGDLIDQEIDFTAAHISFSTNTESCIAGLSMHKKDADKILHLFSGMIRSPAFDGNKLVTAKNVMIESLSRVYDDQQKLAFREFRKLIFADNVRGKLPSLRSIAYIKREDLIVFHNNFFYPGNTRIAITGDITKQEAITLIQRHFGDWKYRADIPDIPLPRPSDRGRVYFLDKPSPQSVVLLGLIVPGKISSDYYALSILDFILGSGGFRSRITQVIRNDRGLAYSAGGFYSVHAKYGILQTYAITKSESAPDAISIMRSVLQDLRNASISDSELAWAKSALTGNFIFSFESSEQIAMQQLMLDFEGVSSDFLDRYSKGMEAVTVQDVRRVALQYLTPDKALIFVVGDGNNILPLSRLGKVTRVDWKK